MKTVHFPDNTALTLTLYTSLQWRNIFISVGLAALGLWWGITTALGLLDYDPAFMQYTITLWGVIYALVWLAISLGLITWGEQALGGATRKAYIWHFSREDNRVHLSEKQDEEPPEERFSYDLQEIREVLLYETASNHWRLDLVTYDDKQLLVAENHPEIQTFYDVIQAFLIYPAERSNTETRQGFQHMVDQLLNSKISVREKVKTIMALGKQDAVYQALLLKTYPNSQALLKVCLQHEPRAAVLNQLGLAATTVLHLLDHGIDNKATLSILEDSDLLALDGIDAIMLKDIRRIISTPHAEPETHSDANSAN